MFENPRRGRQARNFTTNVPKILDLKSSSEQIFSENWRWVPLSIHLLSIAKMSTLRSFSPSFYFNGINWPPFNFTYFKLLTYIILSSDILRVLSLDATSPRAHTRQPLSKNDERQYLRTNSNCNGAIMKCLG